MDGAEESLLSRPPVEERGVAWAAHFRRLAGDDERLSKVLAGLRFVAFECLLPHRCIPLTAGT